MERVGVAEFQDDYADRLVAVHAPGLRNLSLLALEIHDLLLAKLTRNSPKDRHDVGFLGEKGIIKVDVLEDRYKTSMRPYLANPDRHDLTLELWIAEIHGAGDGLYRFFAFVFSGFRSNP